MYRLLPLALLISLLLCAAAQANKTSFLGDQHTKVARGSLIYVGDGKEEVEIFEGDVIYVERMSALAQITGRDNRGKIVFLGYIKQSSEIKVTEDSNSTFEIGLEKPQSKVEIIEGNHLSSSAAASLFQNGVLVKINFVPIGRKIRVRRQHAYAVGRASHYTAEAFNDAGKEFLRVTPVDDITGVYGYYDPPNGTPNSYTIEGAGKAFDIICSTTVEPSRWYGRF